MLKAYIALQNLLGDLKDDIKGASLVEYALLVALVAVAAITALGLLGDQISGQFTQIRNQLRDALT